MLTLTITLGLVLTYLFVIAPMRQAQEIRARRDFDDAMHNLKLRMVRRYYYDILKDLSFAEIEERFDIDKAYDRITVRREAFPLRD